MAVRIGIVGDYDTSFAPHPATDAALEHAASALGLEIRKEWLPTTDIAAGSTLLESFDGFWIAPGSPYRQLSGALRAIEFARIEDRPLLGTCGGCQHVVLEYARNVLRVEDAQHAEYDPYASVLFVVPLSCSLVGQRMEVRLDRDSRVAAFYGRDVVEERYYCNFGLNPEFEGALHSAGLSIVGHDTKGEARVVEIASHRFFCATLFVPQLSCTGDAPHPLILQFVKACAESRTDVGSGSVR